MDKKLSRDIEKELEEISFRSYAVYVEGKLISLQSLLMLFNRPRGAGERYSALYK